MKIHKIKTKDFKEVQHRKNKLTDKIKANMNNGKENKHIITMERKDISN